MCILVVEDDRLIRTILVEELIDAGHEVAQASHGQEALDLLPGLPAPVSVLVTDVHMPGAIDGIGLAAAIRERVPDLPVIFTTGRPDALSGRVRLDPRQVLIRKPYRPDEILGCIESLRR